MNRAILTTLALITTLTLTACNEVTVNWVPSATYEQLEATNACRVEVVPQPSASVHFTVVGCRVGTEALVQISGRQTRVRNTLIWTPNPRRVESQYWIHTQVIDGRNSLPLPISGNTDYLGVLVYAW